MTCAICGSPDDVAMRDDRLMCTTCAERTDWARIIEIVQNGMRIDPTIAFEDVPATPIGADPFA